MINQQNQIRITKATQDILKHCNLPLHGQEAVNIERAISSFYIRGYVDRGLDEKKKKLEKKARKKKSKASLLHFWREALIDQGFIGK